MPKQIKWCFLIFAGLLMRPASAVQISESGSGEVLIYPYYSVNNGLDTLYSVVNTTEQTKALKVLFYEGNHGRSVLSFNVYLSPNDVWIGLLYGTTSTIPNHVGEDSVAHATNDTSCAPFLNKAGQEFLPYEIDLDQPNNNMRRAKEGFLVIIEMGVLTGAAVDYVDHGFNGVPASCASIANAWPFGEDWALDPLADPSGGLMGSATLVNVGEGVSFPYDAIALDGFWAQAGEHIQPGIAGPNLASAAPSSWVMTADQGAVLSEWATGYEAVSAVLMKSEIYNEYAFDRVISAKSDWVLTFPTKFFHTDHAEAAAPPFDEVWDGAKSCDEFDFFYWDREQQQTVPCSGCVADPPPPRPPEPVFCHNSNVFAFVHRDDELPVVSQVLGSNNLALPIVVGGLHSHMTENGWAKLIFKESAQVMSPVSGHGFVGLPVTGFLVQQFTNLGAQPGLLAQFNNLFMHKGKAETIDPE